MSDHNPQLEHEQVVVFQREKIEPLELGFEQIKFVFKKLSEWLLERRQETLEQLMEMLERLRTLYPRAYQILMQQIQAALAGYLNPSPAPQYVPIPAVSGP
jgi:hypothetical protein